MCEREKELGIVERGGSRSRGAVERIKSKVQNGCTMQGKE